jgi:hypothetical protein
VGTALNLKTHFNMMAGGTGVITVDSLDASLNNVFYLNFETGNAGSFTFGSKSVTNNAGGTWEYLINNGQVSIDGVVETDQAKFDISGTGLSNTIALIPEPAVIGMLGLGAAATILLRRIFCS